MNNIFCIIHFFLYICGCMRSIKDITKYQFLGKWISNRLPGWDDEIYYCVGESDEYVYIWYRSKFDVLVHQYPKILEDLCGNFGEFYVSDNIPGEYMCFGWEDVSNYGDLIGNYLDKKNIRWIR